jgi:ubiquinone/menaquinone biosynthesis C-methylase UbiE
MREEIIKKYVGKYSLDVVDNHNSLELYEGFFKNMGLKKTIKDMITEKIEGKGKVKVMDIGSGDCGFLHDLKKIFGEKIETIGIDLLVPEKKPDKIIPGDALEIDFPQNIDFVFSFRALHEIGEPEKIVKKVYNCLAKNGKAFLSFRTADLYFGGNGIGEIGEKEIKQLQKMVKNGRLGGFNVKGFEVIVANDKESIVAGVNIFLEKDN